MKNTHPDLTRRKKMAKVKFYRKGMVIREVLGKKTFKDHKFMFHNEAKRASREFQAKNGPGSLVLVDKFPRFIKV